jgi:hypothetical protein
MIGPRKALLLQLQRDVPFEGVAACEEARKALGRVLMQLAYQDRWDTVLTRPLLRSIGADFGIHYCGPPGRVCSVGDLVGSDGMLLETVRQKLV